MLSVTMKITLLVVPSVKKKVVQVINLVHTVFVMLMAVCVLSTMLPMLMVSELQFKPMNQVPIQNKIQLQLHWPVAMVSEIYLFAFYKLLQQNYDWFDLAGVVAGPALAAAPLHAAPLLAAPLHAAPVHAAPLYAAPVAHGLPIASSYSVSTQHASLAAPLAAPLAGYGYAKAGYGLPGHY